MRSAFDICRSNVRQALSTWLAGASGCAVAGVGRWARSSQFTTAGRCVIGRDDGTFLAWHVCSVATKRAGVSLVSASGSLPPKPQAETSVDRARSCARRPARSASGSMALARTGPAPPTSATAMAPRGHSPRQLVVMTRSGPQCPEALSSFFSQACRAAALRPGPSDRAGGSSRARRRWEARPSSARHLSAFEQPHRVLALMVPGRGEPDAPKDPTSQIRSR